jgi:hypothetical protein
VLRTYYTGPSCVSHKAWIALAAAALLSGCSVSMVGSSDAPATTGSIRVPVDVKEPLPTTLGLSDATRIGETAALALWEPDAASTEWINAATGSSGTVEPQAAAAAAENAQDCQPFETMVTSIGGVHRYSGRLCRGDGARPTVEIADPVPATSS